MKRDFMLIIMLCCVMLTACNSKSIGIIGGADGPTSVIVAEKKNDADKYLRKNYVDKRRLPIPDVKLENPFVSDDRTLVLDDSIDNGLELMIYEYYKNIMSGSYQEVKNVISGESLEIAVKNDEEQFKNGIYYSRIFLDEVELVDKDDLNEISENNKQRIVETLNNLGMTEFAIVEVEKTIKHNEKSLSSMPQVGDGEVTRYYLLGKKNDEYKIIEVYWEGFMND